MYMLTRFAVSSSHDAGFKKVIAGNNKLKLSILSR